MGIDCKFRECRPPDDEGCRPVQCRKCGRWIRKFCGDHRTLHAGCPAPDRIRRPWQCGQQWSVSSMLADIRWQASELKGFGDVAAWVFRAVGIRKAKDCNCSKRQTWINNWWPLAWLWSLPKTLRKLLTLPANLLHRLLWSTAGVLVYLRRRCSAICRSILP